MCDWENSLCSSELPTTFYVGYQSEDIINELKLRCASTWAGFIPAGP